MSLHPSAGVRILLERQGHPASEHDPAAAAGASYRAAILTPAERFDFTVTFDAAGTPEIAPAAASASSGEHAAPSERARDLLRSIARTVGRHALAERPPAWPRRVLRWRKVD